MGVGTCYTVGDSEKDVRRFWRGWPIQDLELCQVTADGKVVFRVEATCEISISCDQCGRSRCLGCGERVSIDITGGGESVSCIPRCEE